MLSLFPRKKQVTLNGSLREDLKRIIKNGDADLLLHKDYNVVLLNVKFETYYDLLNSLLSSNVTYIPNGKSAVAINKFYKNIDGLFSPHALFVRIDALSAGYALNTYALDDIHELIETYMFVTGRTSLKDTMLQRIRRWIVGSK